MSDDRPERTAEPHDRLTRLCAAMTTALHAHPEYGEDVQCIVFLDSDAERKGGLQLDGYEDDSEALAHLFMHLRALFRSQGKELLFVPLGGQG